MYSRGQLEQIFVLGNYLTDFILVERESLVFLTKIRDKWAGYDK